MVFFEIARFLVKIYIKIFYRVKYYGVENIPQEGGYLLCSNHVTGMDMFFMGVKIKRKVHWMAKAELFKIPVVNWLIRLLGAFPVERGKGDTRAAKTTLDLLAEGKIVGIFPQGTRTKNKDISKIKVRHGAARFAIESGKPIFPVGISGGEKLFSEVNVVYGKPYCLEYEPGKNYTKSDYAAMSEKIMEKIYEMIKDVENGNKNSK